MSQASIFFHTSQERDDTIAALEPIVSDWGPVSTLHDTLHVETEHGLVGLTIKFNKHDWCQNDAEIIYPDDYYRFKWYIDLYADENHPERDFHRRIEKILSHFWGHNIPAVASGYEDEGLLHDAGYESTEVPWPNDRSEVG